MHTISSYVVLPTPLLSQIVRYEWLLLSYTFQLRRVETERNYSSRVGLHRIVASHIHESSHINLYGMNINSDVDDVNWMSRVVLLPHTRTPLHRATVHVPVLYEHPSLRSEI
jgi:hypothetical protein